MIQLKQRARHEALKTISLLGHAQLAAGFGCLMGLWPSISIIGSLTKIQIKTLKKKDMHRFASIQKDCTLPQKQMTSTIAGTVNAHT
jgi:hypothetical protein